MKPAVLFPGQGAQHVGMGKDFLESHAAARAIFDRAREVLGFDVAKLCSDGPEEELHRTEICQPAILTTSFAIVSTLHDDADEFAQGFAATAGLSLGEYTALVFAGALTFEDAVALVRNRGRYMQECSDSKPSGMVSLLGADEETAQRICDKIREGEVAGVANLNGAGQVVVSGDTAAMERVVGVAKEFGVRRAIPLKVSGAFHSELMRDAADRLQEDLKTVEIREPRIDFLSNVSGGRVSEPEKIREYLGQQVCSPVRWEDSMRGMLDAGIRRFVEPGPGKVLSGLAKKIDRESDVCSITSPDEANAAGDWLGAPQT